MKRMKLLTLMAVLMVSALLFDRIRQKRSDCIGRGGIIIRSKSVFR